MNSPPYTNNFWREPPSGPRMKSGKSQRFSVRCSLLEGLMGSDRKSYMKRGRCSAICRLSGRITVKLVGFRKRMSSSRQCNGTTVEE